MHYREKDHRVYNRPFPSSLCLCFKTSPSAKPFTCKSVLLTSSFKCKSNSFSYERFCTWTRLETEAEGNSEMAYSTSGSGLLLWATYEASLGTYWTLLRTWNYKHQDRTQNKAGLLYFCKIHPNCRASAGPVSRNISSITICVWLWVRESGNREYYGKQMTGDCIY